MTPTEDSLRQSREVAKAISEEFGVDFDSMEFDHYMEDSFVGKTCRTTEQAIRFKFPHIQNLDVSMNDDGLISIIFDQTDESPSQQQVTEFLVELKRYGTDIAPINQPQ